jgi:hypothetical protein
MLEEQTAPYFAGDLGYHAVQTIPGVGPVLAAVFVAEIGDIARFKSGPPPLQLGRADPDSQRVRRHGAPGPHHQARVPPRALGRRRGRGPTTRRHAHPTPPPQRGRTPGHSDRPRGGGAQTSHPRLLPSERKRSSLDTPTWPRLLVGAGSSDKPSSRGIPIRICTSQPLTRTSSTTSRSSAWR